MIHLRNRTKEDDPNNEEKSFGDCMTTDTEDRYERVNPKHYTRAKTQPIEVIEEWGLPTHLANVVKYVQRHDAKDGLKDLRKAVWYLERYIWLQEGSQGAFDDYHVR